MALSLNLLISGFALRIEMREVLFHYLSYCNVLIVNSRFGPIRAETFYISLIYLYLLFIFVIIITTKMDPLQAIYLNQQALSPS